MRKPLAFLLVALCAPTLTTAQLEMESARERMGGGELALETAPRTITGEATLNLVYDDGEVDNGLTANFPNRIEYAMRFDAGAASALTQIQICFSRLFSFDSASGTFPVTIYAVGGGGSPGTPLHGYTASVSSFPETGLDGQFRTFNVSPAAVPASFFIGVEMDSTKSDLFLCIDEDGAARPMYGSQNDGPWVNLATARPEAKNLMIRARVETQDGPPPPPPGSCVPDAQTACLQNSRFEVEVDWNNNQGAGTGQVMSFGGQRAENNDSAFYSFQSPTNFEMGVKMLDACIPLFGNKFWVFISGLTDQGWTVTVRDTQTGAFKTYSNTQGQLSETFADTSAFDC